MFKASRRYRRRTVSFKRVFLVTVGLFSLFTAAGIWLVNEQMKPAVMAVALTQAEQIGNYAINYGQGEDVLTNLSGSADPNPLPVIDMNKLIATRLNKKQEVVDYSLNAQAVNHLKSLIADRVLWFLRATEKGQISLTNGPEKDLRYEAHPQGEAVIADIPLGQILNNALLSNYGPTIPVEMEVVSNIQNDVHWTYQNVGINTVVVTVYLDISVKVDVIVPFAMKSETIQQHLLLGSRVLPLNVPYYYSSGNGEGITPAVPIEKPAKSSTSSGSH
ncbi:MAG: sporulation protein YunB [Sporolactobacillus sp.]